MKTLNATEAKNNFGLFIETLMMDEGVIITRNGRRIALCKTTEEELMRREQAKEEASRWLSRSLQSPVPPATEQATAGELMELMDIGGEEARELFPEKFGK